ncbi:beta-ketoacyl-[acyl-carrier-protein] synthase family protein [Streptomyces sp. P38-E01]|uniref:Beta-ketoacyl-[acyl-carrier-protein] synthase family protein n=1 Tax=Streptomyces tardus TaxID=2780544 RepID=A0A949JEK3_9ACTN|nr:beta-ketoacyl-[acyl-carrier-protein] synthase family protein [Streptomyces tardus]MBU7598526.1 beta-ketoacyl-[acyl-carrier-protein] synthase family protein [Streptomyces tardus]
MMPTNQRRVVVTGTGVVSPIGHGTEEFWQSLSKGSTNFVPSGVEGIPLVSRVPDGWDEGISPKRRRASDRCTLLALTAAGEALGRSGLLEDPDKALHTGVYFGSSIGGIGTIKQEFARGATEGTRSVHALLVVKGLMNMIASAIGIEYGLRGESLVTAAACASGTVAIGEAYRAVASGRLPRAVAGGAEACVLDHVMEPFRKLGALNSSSDPEGASIPFSRHRSGFVMAEGAGAVVLEDLESARERGAPILGEIVGYAASSDAAGLITPDAAGVRRAVEGVFSDDHRPEDVVYINAHGTSTTLNERVESEVYSAVFPHRPAVSSTKSYYGHPLGAAGAFEVIVCLESARAGVALPTLNVSGADIDRDEIDLNLVLDEPAPLTDGLLLSSSFAFGGQNGVLLMRGGI